DGDLPDSSSPSSTGVWRVSSSNVITAGWIIDQGDTCYIIHNDDTAHSTIQKSPVEATFTVVLDSDYSVCLAANKSAYFGRYTSDKEAVSSSPVYAIYLVDRFQFDRG